MAHYAFLNANNVVIEVIKGIDETELIEGLDTETWYGNFRGQVCKRTSYNNNIRKQFCGVGFIYDADADVFIAPKSYPSWTLDNNYDWQPATLCPVDVSPDNPYVWNETDFKWVAI